ncbi:MAG: hypothetical protein ACYCX2_03740 [Christensenellales bacterium]
MKRFLKDSTGSALIWAVFLILVLCTVSVVVYSGVMIYAKYQTCETEVQRVATQTTNMSMVNANLRDLELDIPAVSAEDYFYENLTETGWAMADGCWRRCEDGKLIYSLEDMTVDIVGKTIRITATFAMPLPWGIGGIGEVHIPIDVRSSVLYIE